MRTDTAASRAASSTWRWRRFRGVPQPVDTPVQQCLVPVCFLQEAVGCDLGSALDKLESLSSETEVMQQPALDVNPSHRIPLFERVFTPELQRGLHEETQG